MGNITISAVIITYNEERNIDRCLTSLSGVADDIVVLDSFSQDQTQAICQRHGVRFFQHAFDGHIQQKNRALALAQHDWVLSLDADEALTPQLRESIIKIKNNPIRLGYQFNRLTNYCGHWVRHCGWYPDRKLRLVHRHHAYWGGMNPHDRLIMSNGEPIGFLHGDLLHYSFYTQQDHLRKIEYFGAIASKELFERGKPSNWFVIMATAGWQFFKSFFLKRGFLDGKIGFTISRLNAYGTYRKYKMLLELYRNQTSQ